MVLVAVEEELMEKAKEMFLERGFRASLWYEKESGYSDVVILPAEYGSCADFVIELGVEECGE